MRKRIVKLLLLSFLVQINFLYGQTTIWSEDFDSESVYNLEDHTNNWQCDITTTSDNDWYVSDGAGGCSSYITSGKALTIYAGSSWECDYWCSSEATDKIAYYSSEINASNYIDLTIDFDWICNGQSGSDYFTVVYSTDNGSSWTDLATQYNGQTTWQSVTNLDISALDGDNFLIGFRWINNSSTCGLPPAIIDNVEIKGTSIPQSPTFHNTGSSSQLAFNNSYINDDTPTFRASATHTGSFNRFQVEINTNSTFSGTAYTQTFSNTFSSGNQYDLECNSLSSSLPTTDGVTYYVRTRASDDGGSNWSPWSTETYSFTYKTSGDVDWYQTTDAQFNTGAVVTASDDDYGNTSTQDYSAAGYLNNGEMMWYKVTVAESSYIESLSVRLANTNGTVQMALYDSNGDKVAETNSASCVSGENTLSTTTNPLLSAEDHYVAVMLSSSSQRFYYSYDEGLYWGRYTTGGTYGTFPASLASGSEWNRYFEIFLTTSTPATTTSPAIQYASFDGASSWDELNWTASGAGTVEVGVYSDASCSTQIIAPTSTSPIDLSSLNSTTYPTLYLKATLNGASPSLDDWKVTCNYGLDLDSEAEAPSTQVASANIASTNDTDGEAQEVFAFDITDLGTADGQPTKVTNIRIKPGNNNAGDWTDFIHGVKLYDNDASGFVTIGSPTITDTYIDIPIASGNLNVANGGTQALSLYIYLNNSGISDNAILDFRIDYDDHGFTAAADGSRFADTFGSADIEGNDMTVTVTATELQFDASEPGSIEALSQDFGVIVYATDENGNMDADYSTGNVTLSVATGSGSLSSVSGLTQSLSTGEISWTDVQYDATETCPSGLIITASHSGSLTSVSSSCIEILGVPEAFSITSADASGCAGGNISVTWDASSGADSYNLYWCNTADCDASAGANIITGVISPYSFSINDAGVEYRITIKAINVASETWADNVMVYTTYDGASWSGDTNTDWNTASNWCGGAVPDCEDDITIVAGLSNYPVLSTNASVRSLTIESGASVSLSSYTLSAYGDLDLSGTLNAGTGTITMTNDGCASAPGDQTLDPGSNSLHNLALDNSGTITLVNNNLTLSGNLTISDGTFDANDLDLTIAGNWTNYALFIPGSGAVTFNGSGNSTILKNGPEVVVYSTGFEDDDGGIAGWNLGTSTGHTEWRRMNVAGGGNSAYQGTYDVGTYDLVNNLEHAHYYSTNTDNNTYVDLSRTLDLTSVSEADISFYYYCDGTGDSEYGGYFMINGNTIDDQLYSQTSWANKTYSLDAYCNDKVILTFRQSLIYQGASPSGNYGFTIDDLHVTGTESMESFNSLIVDKNGASVLLDNTSGQETKLLCQSDVEIKSGTLNAQGNMIRCKGDFIVDGTFTPGNGAKVEMIGDATQKICGSSNIEFYDLEKLSASDLIIGDDLSSGNTIEVTNAFHWKDNNDNLIIGDGQTVTFIIPDDLTIFNGCTLETKDNSVISIAGSYTDEGTYTPNQGTVKFHGSKNSNIIREPAMIIYSENFESGTANGWTLDNSYIGGQWEIHQGAAYNSNYDLAIKDHDIGVPYDYLWGGGSAATGSEDASVDIDLTGYENVELQFYWRCGGEANYDYGQVLVDDGSGEVVLMDDMHSQPYYTISPRIDISQYANQNVTLIFRFHHDASGGDAPGFCIDNIKLAGTSNNLETFYNLSVDKDDDSYYALLRCPIDIDNDVTITNGYLNSGGIDFPVGRHWFNLNTSTFTHGNNTVTFDGNGEGKSQTITNNALNKFYNIKVDNTGGTVDLETNRLYIENDLELTAGTFDADDQDIMIEGDWNNLAGTFQASDKTVYFRGDENQQLISDGDAFFNLSLPFADIPNAGDPVKENSVVLNDNLNIDNHLTLSAGSLDVDDTYDIEIKGNWYNEGGNFIHPNNETTTVTFSGTSTQKVNLKTDDTKYDANFSFDDVEIDGADVRFYVDSDNFLLLVRNMIINTNKNFKLIQLP